MAGNDGFFKPWKDGPIENAFKLAGAVWLFLFVNGLVGASLDPLASNPYVWGLWIRQVVTGFSR